MQFGVLYEGAMWFIVTESKRQNAQNNKQPLEHCAVVKRQILESFQIQITLVILAIAIEVVIQSQIALTILAQNIAQILLLSLLWCHTFLLHALYAGHASRQNLLQRTKEIALKHGVEHVYQTLLGLKQQV